MAGSTDKPWLPTDLDSVCDHCLQVYVYEHRYHCLHCDGPMCPLCVVVREEVWLCPCCAEAAQDEE